MNLHRWTASVPSMSHHRLHHMTPCLLLPLLGSLLPQGPLSSITIPGMLQGHTFQGAPLLALASEAHGHSPMGPYSANPVWNGHPTRLWLANNEWHGLAANGLGRESDVTGWQSQARGVGGSIASHHGTGSATSAHWNGRGCASSLTFVSTYVLTAKIGIGQQHI